jgi:hypothetical protein
MVAGGPGFEPRFSESESDVLPLNYPPPKKLKNNSFFGGFTNPNRNFYKSAGRGDLYKAVAVFRLSLWRNQLEALPTVGS